MWTLNKDKYKVAGLSWHNLTLNLWPISSSISVKKSIKKKQTLKLFYESLLLFSHSVMSDYFWPHGLQYTSLPCPSLSPGFAQTHVHWVGDAIQPSHPLSSPSPALHLSQHQVFSNELVLCSRWPKYWSFSFSPSNEYSGLISFRIDRLDLAVQGTLKSLLQHHNWKASTLQCSAFFMVQLSYSYMTTGKTKLYYMNLCWQSDVSAF